MRRMYGDQRHLQVLRAELVDEDGFNDLHGEFDHHRDYHESDFKSRYFGEYTNEVERRDEEEQRLRDGTEKVAVFEISRCCHEPSFTFRTVKL